MIDYFIDDAIAVGEAGEGPDKKLGVQLDEGSPTIAISVAMPEADKLNKFIESSWASCP